MCDNTENDAKESKNEITTHPTHNNNQIKECRPIEEVTPTDSSEEYLSEPLRFHSFQNCNQSTSSNITLLAESMTISENSFSCDNGNFLNNIQIPIVGYEIMEERARFTVYKLRVENKASGDCWYVFRRYTDFVRLCNRLRNKYPQIVQHLPRKRWLKNNFDPLFLDERVNGLQTLVNSILSVPDLVSTQHIQDFFCLNEPPMYSETNEESRAIFEALDETISDLKQQIRERDMMLDSVQEKFHSVVIENENLKKIIRNSLMKCEECKKECDKYSNLIK